VPQGADIVESCLDKVPGIWNFDLYGDNSGQKTGSTSVETMNLMGQRLIQRKSITQEQLGQALERQRQHGGKLGQNLLALGFITKEEIEAFLNPVPRQPKTIKETGLTEVFINELILKHAVDMTEFTIKEMSRSTGLPPIIMDQCITTLRRERFLEVKGGADLSKMSYRFSLSDAARDKGARLKDLCRYTGPAPVPFKDYAQMVAMQSIKNINVNEEAIRNAFEGIIATDEVVETVGPAMSSGKAIFLYGPPGNGKTSISEAIGRVLPGAVYIPHAVIIDGEIVTIYDKSNHSKVDPDPNAGPVDQRWVRAKRPVVIVGGEMTLKGLDLDYNPVSKYYVGPLQLKANNGMFLVDDFGRQQVDPQVLLNRWIVPLERRTDYLSFHTGMKIEIPFDQLVIFSTNLDPKKLVDEAFLRRIRYKIKIDYPTLEDFEQIFRLVCRTHQIEFRPDVFNFLITDLYEKNNIPLTACHCRDLLENIIDKARFMGRQPEMTEETITESWHTYYVPL
jgi:hypothetical protein